MPFIRLCLAAAILLGATVEASAEGVSNAGDYLRYCETTPKTSALKGLHNGICVGFVNGAVSQHHLMVFVYGSKPLWCEPLPNLVSTGQYQAIWIKHLKANPEKWHNVAGLEFIDAMKDALPCKE